jgi:hypothetical protein
MYILVKTDETRDDVQVSLLSATSLTWLQIQPISGYPLKATIQKVTRARLSALTSLVGHRQLRIFGPVLASGLLLERISIWPSSRGLTLRALGYGRTVRR